jgi:ribosomal protein S18 acetylase RimI-like enzyme
MTDKSVASPDPVRIETLKIDPGGVRNDLERLGNLLHACVCAGASVSFVLPFSHDDAKAFWSDQVLPAVDAGSRCVLVARSTGNIVGTVQLDLATPPNQPHRAEVKKLLVHPDARRRGIARSLMVALEAQALEACRTLLTLDTVTGSPAEALYRSLGYVAVGAIPGYALNFNSSVLEATLVMYKKLSTGNAAATKSDPLLAKLAGTSWCSNR